MTGRRSTGPGPAGEPRLRPLTRDEEQALLNLGFLVDGGPAEPKRPIVPPARDVIRAVSYLRRTGREDVDRGMQEIIDGHVSRGRYRLVGVAVDTGEQIDGWYSAWAMVANGEADLVVAADVGGLPRQLDFAVHPLSERPQRIHELHELADRGGWRSDGTERRPRPLRSEPAAPTDDVPTPTGRRARPERLPRGDTR